jgi:HAD superfamily hydrolase (TIGR01484 family)
MSAIRLLSMDFDGTLVRDWAPPPYPETLVRTLNQLRRNGVLFAVNTGRTIHHVEEGLEYTGFPVRPDFALTVEREVFRWTGAKWEDYGEWNSLCHEEHDNLYVKVEGLLQEIEEHVESKTAARLYYEEGRLCGVIANTPKEMDEICRFIAAQCIGFPDFAYQRNSVYLRFCHAAYHKGTALAELQRLTNISSDETFAAGDNFNDLPMLSLTFARFLGCPSNAIEDVKETVRNQGGFVAAQDSGLGVDEALRYFFSGLL